MAHLQEAQLRLGSLSISLAKQSARTDCDQGLLHIIGSAKSSIRIRQNKVGDTILLILLKEGDTNPEKCQADNRAQRYDSSASEGK